MQTVFKIGFDQIARLRTQADSLVQLPGFSLTMLDVTDQEFMEALRRFKPLLIEDGRYRNFRSLADIEKAQFRLQALTSMAGAMLDSYPSIASTFARTFNTSTVRAALYGIFEPAPLRAQELEMFLANGFELPAVEVPASLQPFSERWWSAFRAEMEPLVGKRVDPRFIETVIVQL
jgi:hypothetical protein